MTRQLITLSLLLATLGGCDQPANEALGTLEFDRVTLTAPASEYIIAIEATEGQRLDNDAVVLRLNTDRAKSRVDAADAEVKRLRFRLDELTAGTRGEEIRQARARYHSAAAKANDDQRHANRIAELGQRNLASTEEVSHSASEATISNDAMQLAKAQLDESLSGTRNEEVSQANAALAVAEARLRTEHLALEDLTIAAPAVSLVDSLPYNVGDRPPVGAPLATLLIGEAPYARVYVPQMLRADLQLGDTVQVHIEGQETSFEGRLRMIRSEPSFTPYYALVGDDAARLSYLAEIQLGKDAADLPAGLPVQATVKP